MVRKRQGLAVLEIGFAIGLLPFALARDRHPHHESWDAIKPAYLVDEAVELNLGASRKRVDGSRTRLRRGSSVCRRREADGGNG
jgi:hypothetical protein